MNSRTRTSRYSQSVAAVASMAVVATLVAACVNFAQDKATEVATPASSATSARSISGTVSGAAAVTLIDQFYSNLIVGSSTIANSWELMTSSAQAIYRSEAAFVDFWESNGVTDFRNISARSYDADGSVEVTLASLSYGGNTKSMSIQVVMQHGKTLIDSATK